MTTSGRESPVGEAFWLLTARALSTFFVAALLSVVWFVCRFLLPKFEARWMDLGIRPSLASRMLLVSSSVYVRYFWIIAPILLGCFLLTRGTKSRDRSIESPMGRP
jgi:type II secretory pathway component PulF